MFPGLEPKRTAEKDRALPTGFGWSKPGWPRVELASARLCVDSRELPRARLLLIWLAISQDVAFSSVPVVLSISKPPWMSSFAPGRSEQLVYSIIAKVAFCVSGVNGAFGGVSMYVPSSLPIPSWSETSMSGPSIFSPWLPSFLSHLSARPSASSRVAVRGSFYFLKDSRSKSYSILN